MKRAGEGRDVLQAVSLGRQGWAEGRMQGGVGGEEEGEELREDGLKRKPYTTRDEKGACHIGTKSNPAEGSGFYLPAPATGHASVYVHGGDDTLKPPCILRCTGAPHPRHQTRRRLCPSPLPVQLILRSPFPPASSPSSVLSSPVAFSMELVLGICPLLGRSVDRLPGA
ncbi:hypothetical protein AcW1_006306 [Taiwanofungus camphoratus]|nr:hypothetical protein AcW1_006306 [Antrodia cinnamomea]